MICPDCLGRAPADCPGCDGTGLARDTLPAPPPPEDAPPESGTRPTVDALGETWPDTMRKHDEP